MKYLWVLFVFLFAFTVFVTFTVIAGGDIENILDPEETSNETKTPELSELSESSELIVNPGSPGYNLYNTENGNDSDGDGEKQISVSVLDAKTNKVSTVDLEEYLCGVVFSEMPSSFELEALKAQAVAARSYCVYKMLYSTEKTREEHQGADICNDYTHCKDYISYEEAREKYGEDYIKPLWKKIEKSVYSTKNEIVTYETEPAIAVFHAISGSETESAENIWGNPVPYLVSVPSEEENRSSEIKNYITENIFDANEFKEILTSNGFRADFSQDPSSWISNITLNSSNRVDTVDICGKTTTGRRLREIFSLRSTNFALEYKDESFVFTVTGYGHGVGM